MSRGLRRVGALVAAALCVVSWAGATLGAQEPASPATIAGRVLDPELRPVVGAQLGLRAGGDAFEATADLLGAPVATTTAGGILRMPAPAGDVLQPTLVVAADGLATFEIVAPSGDLGDLVMVRGVKMIGSVRDTEGEPLSGVEVTARDALLEVAPLRAVAQGRAVHVVRARSDARGLFRLEGALSQALRLEFHKPGYASAVVAPYAFGDPLVAELVPVGVLRGRIVDADGRPVRAEIAVRYSGGRPGPRGRAAIDGAFELGHTARSPSWLQAWAEVDGARQVVEHGPLDGAIEGLVLTLERPEPEQAGDRPRLLLRALAAETGEPLADFRAGVVWSPFAANQPFDNQWRQVATRLVDAVGGVAALPSPGPGQPSTGVLIVGGPGRSWTAVTDGVAWDPDSSGEPIRVELPAESILRGRVVDPDTGAPLPGVRVGWVGVSPTYGFAGRAVDRLRGSPSEARTDPDGSFELRGLPAGRGGVVVACDDRPDRKPIGVDLAAGEEREGLEIAIPAGATLRGALVGFEGGPGFRVAVRGVGVGGGVRPAAVPRPEAAVVGEGTFVVPALADGFYALDLVLPRSLRGGPAQRVPVEVFRIRGGADRDLEVDVSRDLPGRLQVRVSISGAALARTRLVLVAEPEAASPWVNPTFAKGPVAVVGADGRAALHLVPGTWRIRAFDVATGAELQRRGGVLVEAGGTSDLELEVMVGAVQVRIARPVDGEPLRRLEVQLDWPQPDGRGGGAVFKYAHDTGVGLDLVDGRSEVTLVLPPLPGRLRIWAGPAQAVEAEMGDDADRDQQALVQREVQVEVGERAEVELVIPERG